MYISTKSLLTLPAVVMLLLCGCGAAKKTTKDLTHINFSVKEAPDWTALFKRSKGWYGGDGIFAIPLNGKENLPASDTSNNMILFSDSMIGDVDNDKPITGSSMIHNSVAIFTGAKPVNDSIHFYWATDYNGEPKAIFIPQTTSSLSQDYYWTGDGFMNTAKNAIYIFAYKMRTLDPTDDWSFTNTRTNLIKIPVSSQPPFIDQQQIETPLAFLGSADDEKGTFGAGIFVNTTEAGVDNGDGYVYVYGIKTKTKNLIAARIRPKDFERFDKWKFWDGKNWNSDLHSVAYLVPNVSDELSVTPLKDGRYLLVYQFNGMSSAVAMRIGASPVGPFGDEIKIFDCPETKENKNYFTYNAKAHPSLSKAGELLISYNVNSFEFLKEIQKSPTLYRPRFIKLTFND